MWHHSVILFSCVIIEGSSFIHFIFQFHSILHLKGNKIGYIYKNCQTNISSNSTCAHTYNNTHLHTHTHRQTHTPSCYYLKLKSLGHISICIHISVKAAELLATSVNSHYQSIWTGLSSAGTSTKSHFTPSTSSNSVPHSFPQQHYLLLAKIKSCHICSSSRSDPAADPHTATLAHLVPVLV